MGSLIIIIAMFVLLWVLLIRPQRNRQRQAQQMLDHIDVGDEILTHGGIYGIVQEFDENDDLIVEIAEGINVRMARRSVASVVKPDEDEDEEGVVEDDEDAAETSLDEGVETVKNEVETVRAEGAEEPTALERR
ncbi:MAG TPA: preprotein translocase subunit YajC [Gaiellaceae bacterium]